GCGSFLGWNSGGSGGGGLCWAAIQSLSHTHTHTHTTHHNTYTHTHTHTHTPQCAREETTGGKLRGGTKGQWSRTSANDLENTHTHTLDYTHTHTHTHLATTLKPYTYNGVHTLTHTYTHTYTIT